MKIGDRFGRYLVVELLPGSRTAATKAVVDCVCGTRKAVEQKHLRSGQIQSCGCLNRELAAQRARDRAKHGMTRSPAHVTWSSMHQRCRADPHYVGKGVTVCERWSGEHGFENFFADMGDRPVGHTIDRVNNDGNYEPGNCRWATPREQASNRRLPRHRNGVPTRRMLAEAQRVTRVHR